MPRSPRTKAAPKADAACPLPLTHGSTADESAPPEAWSIQPLDPKTGQPITPLEAAYRVRIRTEHEQGLIAVDPLYHAAREAIHQPLLNERGELVDDAWELRRANSTTLRVLLDQIGDVKCAEMDPTALQQLAVTIARASIGDVAADLMKILYTYANDPPQWRRPEFTVHLTDLLDRMGYARDDRGVHRSANRKRVAMALLSLHYTHIGIQREEGQEHVGFIAPLLSSLEYRTREPVAHLTPAEVFAQGLPEVITVTINQQWYRLRSADGRPTDEYVLIPRHAPSAIGGRARKGRNLTPVHMLQDYLAGCRPHVPDGRVELTRSALLTVAGITDRNVTNATKTLTRALERLCAAGSLAAYSPQPLPLDPSAYITLVLART
jgi:hypothetical protein